MKNFKSLITTVIIILVAGFFIMFVPNEDGEYAWNPFDYARITEVDYKAVVVDEKGSNGKVVVTERLTFDIHAVSKDNPFWELWRDLPEAYIDGVKVDYKVNSVKQIFEDGTELVYSQSPKLYWEDYDYTTTNGSYGPGKWYHSKGPYNESLRKYECVFFYVDGIYRETAVFEIEYEMYNAALRYNDSSELYLSMYSEDTIKYLKSFKGQILIPTEKMPRTGNYYANTYGMNSHTFPFTESSTMNPGYHTFAFELDKSQLKFRPYNQYIEFALVSHGADKHIFTQHASKNTYYNDDVLDELKEEQAKYDVLPADWNKIKTVVLLLCSVGTFVAIASAFSIIKKIKKKHTFYEPTMKMEYFRDIPSDLDPNFASELVFCKSKATDNIDDGYAAAMLSLVRKGYIELEQIKPEKDWSFNNMKIVVRYNPAPLQPETGSTSAVVGQQNFWQPRQMMHSRPMKACPNCANNNAVEATRCIFCATPFGSDTIISPSSAIPTVNERIIPEAIQLNQAGVNQPQSMLEQQPGQIHNQEQTLSNVKPLTPTEEQYFNLILRHSNGVEITLNSFQQKVSEDYEYTTSFVKNVKTAITSVGISQGYYQKAEYKKPKEQAIGWSTTFWIIGILFITVGNYASYQTRLDLAFGSFFILGIGFIIGAIYLSKEAKKCILLSQFGEDEYAKWRGLYNFLNSATLISERTVIELVLWEQYLIYATAFGISEKVIKALQIRCPNVDASPILRNPYYCSNSFRIGSRSFRTATHTASHTSRSGGHGGYGGGGRGGGGGGGGH